MGQKELYEQIAESVKKEDIRFVHLVFMDIHGFQKTVVIPSEWLESAVFDVTVFDGSSVVGYATIEESDMRLYPDLETFKILPWYSDDHKTAQVICNIHSTKKESNSRFSGDPRNILYQWMKKAEDMGYIFNTGPEYEYFLFKMENGQPTPRLTDRGGYFDLMPMDSAVLVAKEVIRSLQQMKIEVEAGHHEVAPSQYEIDLKYSDAMTAADRVFELKYAIKTIAHNHGLHATFMPKPIDGVNGSGMHIHQSLLTPDGKNGFYDPDAENGLSEMAIHFMGGLMEHAREMSAVLASWPNSYKRLVPGYEAPTYISWAFKNRSALIRVPTGGGKSTRLELRCPDSAGNPYIQFSIILAAGMDGIRRKIEPPAPVETDLFKMGKEERDSRGIKELPSNMGHALDIMQESRFMKDALGGHVFDHFIHAKSKEWDVYRTAVTDWEIKRYLPIL